MKKGQKWIGVKEKLPMSYKEDFIVLREFMFLGQPAQAVAYYTGSHWMESNSAKVLDDVTHWRKKPKPPKKGVR